MTGVAESNPAHRHLWEVATTNASGVRWECKGCGATFSEPVLPRDPEQVPPGDLYYLKEG